MQCSLMLQKVVHIVTTWLRMDDESLNEFGYTTIQQISYQNYACRFHCKGNVLSKLLYVARGPQFEYH